MAPPPSEGLFKAKEEPTLDDVVRLLSPSEVRELTSLTAAQIRARLTLEKKRLSKEKMETQEKLPGRIVHLPDLGDGGSKGRPSRQLKNQIPDLLRERLRLLLDPESFRRIFSES